MHEHDQFLHTLERALDFEGNKHPVSKGGTDALLGFMIENGFWVLKGFMFSFDGYFALLHALHREHAVCSFASQRNKLTRLDLLRPLRALILCSEDRHPESGRL